MQKCKKYTGSLVPIFIVIAHITVLYIELLKSNNLQEISLRSILYL